MDPDPVRKSALEGMLVTVLLAPIAVAFVVAASLAAGPRDVFKALTNRK